MNEKSKKEPATELMKRVAMKAPSKAKIERDFTPEEAAEIFERAEKAKGANKKNAEMTDEERSEEILRKEVIRKIKRTAKALELGNKSKIVLFPSYSKKSSKIAWYKMGDFSAQYYAYRMADRMARIVNLKGDTDRFSRMHVIASIRDIEKFVEQAMKLNEFERYEITLDGIYILYMKKGLTDTELAILRNTEEMRKETMYNVLKPKKAAPEISLSLLSLERQVMKMVSGLERHFRIEIGDDVAKKVLDMMTIYYYYTGEVIDAETARREMTKLAYRIRAGMVFLGDNEVIGPTRACAIGETIARIEELIKEIK